MNISIGCQFNCLMGQLISLGLVCLATFTNDARADFLGSWNLYSTPQALSGTQGTNIIGFTVRVAFGPGAGFHGGADLFGESLIGQDDDGRVFVATAESDSDFELIAEQLANGATSDPVFVEDREHPGESASGSPWDEMFWSEQVGSTAPADFSGYSIERIELVIEDIYWTSPGEDPNGDGNWTSFTLSPRLDFFGTSVPEPTILRILIAVLPWWVLGQRL